MTAVVGVIGAGVAGLAAAWSLRRAAPDVDTVVLEAAKRPGGLVESERTPDGFLLEHGADCLLTSKPAGVRAARELGLGDDLVPGTGTRRSYLAVDDRLVPTPPIFAGPGIEAAWSVLSTPLLSTRGKLRVALEPLVRRAVPPRDESIAAFLGRRFGAELVAAVIGPLVGGIYGGDPARLSAQACVPRLCEIESVHGSLTLGLRRLRRERRKAGVRDDLPRVVTMRDGMESLVVGLARAVGDRLRTGVAVRRIERRGDGRFRVDTSSGALFCDAVILAVPAWASPPLVEGLDADLAAGLAGISHKALDCVSFAWRRADVPHPLDGSGFVYAAGRPRPTTACTWASVKWPGRAPADTVLLRSALEVPDASDADVVAAARDDLRDLLGVTAPPLFTRVRRRPRATPIYEVGHRDRIARLRAYAGVLGPLALAGNAYDGIGVPDCIASGERAAAAVLAALRARPDAPVAPQARVDPSAPAGSGCAGARWDGVERKAVLPPLADDAASARAAALFLDPSPTR